MVLHTSKAFLGSLGIHAVLLSGFLLSFDFDSGKTALPPTASKKLPEPVIAEVLDSAQVELEVARLQAFEDQKRQTEQDRQNKLDAAAAAAQKKRQAEEKRLVELEAKRKADEAKAKQQRKAEVQRLAQLEKERKAQEKQQRALEKKRQVEEQKLKELAAKKQKQANEAARLEAENKRIVAEQKKIAAERKAAEAAKQKAEADRKAKALAKEQARKAAAKKKAEAAARQKAFDNELAAAIAAEENNGEQARDREIYRGLIAQAVQRKWVRPESATVAECVVRVSQIPGGEVTRVSPQAGRCGGNELFQRSVIKAVESASPLPAPPNPDVFEREIEFLFRPQ